MCFLCWPAGWNICFEREGLRFSLFSLSTSHIHCLCGKGLNQDVDLVEVELCQYVLECPRFMGPERKNRSRQVPRVFLQQGDNGFFCKQLFDKIQIYCFREQRPLPVSLAPVYFRCSYPSLLGEDGTKTVSFTSPAVIGSCRNDGWQYFTILLNAGLCFAFAALLMASS